MSSQPPKVFISYARKDNPYKDQLVEHLQGLVDRGVIVSWHDGLLKAGKPWHDEIVKHLDTSRAILLLISPSFIASKYIDNTELKRTSERYARKEICVIPILIRNVHGWNDKPFGEKKLGDFQALPSTLKFIVDCENPDAAFADVVEGIEKAIKNLKQVSFIAMLSSLIPRPPAVGFIPRQDKMGRDIVELLKEELAPKKNQLVVLWGRGGAGKTTLAAEAIREMSETSPVRVVWTSARGRTDFRFATLLDEISIQLGRTRLHSLSPEEKEEQVRALLETAPTLIVLDNFETIKLKEQKACVRFIAERAPCPALITTRSEISEEEVSHISLDAMLLEEARNLLQRLIERTHKPGRFKTLDCDDIIRKTEFNPLLLKWVVRQIELAKKPETALKYLAKGDAEVAELIFDRSFDLERVGDDGRATLLALSLFMPDASRPSLSEVAGFGDDLLRLDKAVENLAATWLIDMTGEDERLIIEGLTYERAKVRLLKDERADEFRQRFVTYFLSYAEKHTQPTMEDFYALEAEKGNLLGAIDVAFEIRDQSSVMKIAVILSKAIDDKISVNSYRSESESAMNGDEQASKAARMTPGEYDEARRTYQQTLAAFRKLGSEVNVAFALQRLGMLAQTQGDLTEARRFYEESLEVSKELGHPSIGGTLHQLAMLAQAQGELEEARRFYEKSLEVSKRQGDQIGIATTLHQLGWLAQDQDRIAEAQQLYNESLEIKKRLGNQNGIASTLHQLGRLAQKQRKLDEARRLYNESLEIKKKLDDQNGIAVTLHALGVLAALQQEFKEARRLYNESLEITKRLGDKRNIALLHNNLGSLEEKENNRIEAAQLFREALNTFEELKSPYAEMARRNLDRIESEPSSYSGLH